MFPLIMCCLREASGYFLGRRKWFRVSGHSMEPALHSGDCVLVKSGVKPALGELVVLRHPKQPELILVKRVSSFGECTFSVSSDNPFDAQDSREFGPLKVNNLLGVVTTVFFKNGTLKFL